MKEHTNKNPKRGWGNDTDSKENILSNERNDRSAAGTDHEGEASHENTFVGTPGEIGPASLAGRYDDERAGGTGGRGLNDGDSMSVRNDNAPHTNDNGTDPRNPRGNQQTNSNPGNNNQRD